MTPRQQRMYDAVRECLARETAWEGVLAFGEAAVRTTVSKLARGESHMAALLAGADWRRARDAYAEERARTLVGVIEEVDHERDAAVRALLGCASTMDRADAIIRLRDLYSEGE